MGDQDDPHNASSGYGGRPYLVIGSGGFAGQRFDLLEDEAVIGRNPDTAITLLDEGLSREHAVILRDPQTGVFSIEDLESSNGTKVNGKAVRSAELCHGDEIQLGWTVFRFLEAGLPVEEDVLPSGLDDDDTQALPAPEDQSR